MYWEIKYCIHSFIGSNDGIVAGAPGEGTYICMLSVKNVPFIGSDIYYPAVDRLDIIP